jgi:hypothetical protein
MEIGAIALRNIYRIAPPCSVLVSMLPYFVDGPVKVIPPDPWAGPRPGDPLLVDPVFFLRAALGGAIAALAVERDQLLRLDAEQAAAVAVRVVRQGVTKGMQGLGTELGHYAEGLRRLASGLKGTPLFQTSRA